MSLQNPLWGGILKLTFLFAPMSVRTGPLSHHRGKKIEFKEMKSFIHSYRIPLGENPNQGHGDPLLSPLFQATGHTGIAFDMAQERK